MIATEKCRVTTCPEQRVDGALYCGSQGRSHLSDAYAGRIRELADGTVIVTAGPQPREGLRQPRWLARQANPEAEGNTMNALGRDETAWARSAA